MSNLQNIIDYYNGARRDYVHLWTGPKDLAAHFGYTDPDQSRVGHVQSLLNTNEKLAKLVKIKSDDIVIDAGCGFGGSALWLSEHIGCETIGLNIVPYQIKIAKDAAAKRDLETRCHFLNQSYLATDLPDSSATVVWGLESIVHTENKLDFAKEAFRLLKPGGRLVIAEYLLSHSPLSEDEQEIIQPFLDGWAMPNLLTTDQYTDILVTAGFTTIKFTDWTTKMKPSIDRLMIKANFLMPFASIFKTFHLINSSQVGNGQAVLSMGKALDKGLWRYIVVTARKPSD